MKVYSKNSLIKNFHIIGGKKSMKHNFSNLNTLKKSKSLLFSHLPRLNKNFSNPSSRNISQDSNISKIESLKHFEIEPYKKIKVNKNFYKSKIQNNHCLKLKEKKLIKMYNFNKEYLKWEEIYNRVRKDNSIVYDPNFSIEKYNNQLLKIAYQNFSYESFTPMKKYSKSMNKMINEDAPKCCNKWTMLCDKIDSFAPQFLIDKLNYFGSSKRVKIKLKKKYNI